MTIRLLRLAALAAAFTAAHGVALAADPSAGGAKSDTAAKSEAREIRWDDLVPKDWDPIGKLREKSVGILSDADPRAQELMRELREAWDNAPTVPEFEGARVKLPGFIVPLEETKAGLKEFLLVPYFGACIHTPPPPANQIVHVVAGRPVPGFRSMDAVWVSGTLRAARQATMMGTSGYRMDVTKVDKYVAPAPK
jgi:hypothetical protein